ncbi:MAG: histidinol-phosphate transaminase [Candidatus Omnitrophota bacterium]
MKKLARKNILKIKSYVPGKPIDEVKREMGLKRVIKLASNENPFGPSPRVLRAIQQEAKELNRYPDGECYKLKKQLAKRLGVGPQQLIFGNGSDEIIVMAIRAFVDSKDEVIIAKPSFLIYEIASKAAGAKVKAVSLKDFRYNLEAMSKAVNKRTKIIFIGNPDNPAGTYVTQNELVNFLGRLRRDVVVFIDEAYFEYVSSSDYPRSIELLKKFKNIIISRTFSKMYGLAGLRIGYGIANEEMVEILNRVRDPFNVNSLAQAAALACLKDRAYYCEVARRLNEQKNFLYEELSAMGVIFRRTATNFILINVGKDSRQVSQELLRKGLIVRDMGAWGLKNFIRLTIGREEENKTFIQALREIL